MKEKIKNIEIARVEEEKKKNEVLNFEHSRLEQIRVLIILKERAEENAIKSKAESNTCNNLLDIMREEAESKEFSNTNDSTSENSNNCDQILQKLAKQKTKNDDLSSTLQNKETELTKLNEIIKENENQILELDTLIKKKENLALGHSKEKENLIVGHSKEKEELGKLIISSEETLKLTEQNLNDTKLKLDQTESIVLLLNEELSKLESSVSKKTQEIEDLKKNQEIEKEKLNKENSTPSNIEFEQMNELLVSLEEALNLESGKLEETKKALEESESVIGILENELGNCQPQEAKESLYSNEEVEALVQELEKQNTEKASLEQVNNEKDQQIFELENALQILLENNENQNNVENQEKSEIKVDNVDLEKVEKLEDDLDKAKKEQDALSNQSEDLKIQIQKLEEEKEKINQKTIKLEGEIKNNQTVKDDLEEKNKINIGEYNKLREIGLDVQKKAVSANEGYKILIQQFQSLKNKVIERRNQQIQIDKNTKILEDRYKELKEMEAKIIEGLKTRMTKEELYEALIIQKENLIKMAKEIKKPNENIKKEIVQPEQVSIPIPQTEIEKSSITFPSSPSTLIENSQQSKSF